MLNIAILFAFSRLTVTYEQALKDGYSILVVGKDPITLNTLQELSPDISDIIVIDRNALAEQTIEGLNELIKDEFITQLPYFYKVTLNRYLNLSELSALKQKLLKTKMSSW